MSDYIMGLGQISADDISKSDETDILEFMQDNEFYHVKHMNNMDSSVFFVDFVVEGNRYIDYTNVDQVCDKLKLLDINFKITVHEYVYSDTDGYYYDSTDEEDE